jgi:hypothetical protein
MYSIRVCMYVCMYYVGVFACRYVHKYDVYMIYVCTNISMYVYVREECRLRMLTYFHAFPPAITFGYSMHFSQFDCSKFCMFVIDCAEICSCVLDAHGHGQR